MSKDLLKIALIGLAATFCISAKQAHNQKEVAMAKCSKKIAEEKVLRRKQWQNEMPSQQR